MSTKILSIDGLNDAKLSQLLEQLISTIPGVSSVNINLLSRKLTLETDGRDMNDVVDDVVDILRKNVSGITVKFQDAGSNQTPPVFSSKNSRFSGQDNYLDQLVEDNPFSEYDNYVDNENKQEEHLSDSPEEEEKEESIFAKLNLPDNTFIRLMEYSFSVLLFLVSLFPMSITLISFFQISSFLLCALSMFFPFEKEWFSKFTISSIITFIVMIFLLLSRNFKFIALALLIFQAGNLVSSLLYHYFNKHLEQTMDVSPTTVNCSFDGVVRAVPITDIIPGMQLVVAPGERFPFTGVIMEGSSQIETDIFSGEPQISDITRDDHVYCGDLNLLNSVTICVTKFQNEELASYFKKTLLLTQNIPSNDPNDNIKRTVINFTILEIIVVAGLSLWAWVTNSPDFWKIVLMGSLAACPCGLNLSMYAFQSSALIEAMKEGILTHSASCLHTLSNLKTMVLGYSGILSDKVYQVDDIFAMEGYDRDQLLTIATYLEQNSQHPIAQAILAEYRSRFKIEFPAENVQFFEVIAGYGVRATYNKQIVLIGNERFMADAEIEIPPKRAKQTCIYMAIAGEFVGVILLSNNLKPSSAHLGNSLSDLGVEHTKILSSCDLSVLQEACKFIGGHEVYSVQSNSLKQQQILSLLDQQEKKHSLAYAGDLEHIVLFSDLCPTIMMGAESMDKVYYASHAIIPSNDPEKISALIKLSKNLQKSIFSCFILFVVAKIALIALSFFSVIPFYAIIIANTLLTIFISYQAVHYLVDIFSPFKKTDNN